MKDLHWAQESRMRLTGMTAVTVHVRVPIVSQAPVELGSEVNVRQFGVPVTDKRRLHIPYAFTVARPRSYKSRVVEPCGKLIADRAGHYDPGVAVGF